MTDEPRKDPMSTGDLAQQLHIQSWRIARVFEEGLVEEPPRIGGRRVIDPAMVPAIKSALESKGWLGESQVEDTA